jgi:hypothetical protein
VSRNALNVGRLHLRYSFLASRETRYRLLKNQSGCRIRLVRRCQSILIPDRHLKSADFLFRRKCKRPGPSTDSTHVLAAVRSLTRLELASEALEELACAVGHALACLCRRGLGQALRPAGPPGQEPRTGEDQDERRRADARWLIGHLADGYPGLLRGPGWVPCGRSSCRTTTGTPPAACAGTMMRAMSACRRRPFRQRPVPALPRQGRLHHLRRRRAHGGLSPRELYGLQLRNRADQQDPAWHKRYTVRSGIEGTIFELEHGPRHTPLPLPRAAQCSP